MRGPAEPLSDISHQRCTCRRTSSQCTGPGPWGKGPGPAAAGRGQDSKPSRVGALHPRANGIYKSRTASAPGGHKSRGRKPPVAACGTARAERWPWSLPRPSLALRACHLSNVGALHPRANGGRAARRQPPVATRAGGVSPPVEPARPERSDGRGLLPRPSLTLRACHPGRVGARHPRANGGRAAGRHPPVDKQMVKPIAVIPSGSWSVAGGGALRSGGQLR